MSARSKPTGGLKTRAAAGPGPTLRPSGHLASVCAAAFLGVTLLAANSMGTGRIFYNSWTGAFDWPEPLRAILGSLAIESWPTYGSVEIRWVVWALAAVVLGGWAIVSRRPVATEDAPGSVFRGLMGVSAILAGLVAIRAVFSVVPLMGLVWTCQLMLGLSWMLVVYAWAVQMPVQTLTRAVALAVGTLAGISLLFCLQGGQTYPNWPSGNVLLLTTACLAGVFLTGTWAYCRLTAGWRRGGIRDYAVGGTVAALFVVTGVVLWMAGRRAGLVGLAGGVIFVAVMALWRRAHANQAAPEPVSPATESEAAARGWGRRVLLGLALAGVVGLGIAAFSLSTAKRWETVQYRVELYKATVATVLERPAHLLTGTGPGHLVFHLTSRMRPLHAESPRLFHGDVEEHSHSEPLQAIAELGLFVGLAYLALPLGGLIGFACSWRTATERAERLAMLGAGAALAAVLAAEATSVGMRRPGVAMLVWTLAGIGWACGARAGGFGWLGRRGWAENIRTGRQAAAGTQSGAGLRGGSATQPRSAWEHALAAAGTLLLLVPLAMSIAGLRASGALYEAQESLKRQQHEEVVRLLAGPACAPDASAWMEWKYLEGQSCLVLMVRAGAEATGWQARTRESLGDLVHACGAYGHAPVLLSMAYEDWGQRKALCERFLASDPYDLRARLMQASYPDATAAQQMQAARLAIRNASIAPVIARLVAQAAPDPAAQQLQSRWMTDAAAALQQNEPAKWVDPLALESLRLAVLIAGLQDQVPAAQEYANQAAALLKQLAADPLRNRLETVEVEVHLDQAWFGWLLRPEGAGEHAEALERHMRGLSSGVVGTYSHKMAGQFVAMLRLSQGQPDEASRALYLTDRTIPRANVERMKGLAYARLVALIGSRVPPAQMKSWTQRGTALLGAVAWKQAQETAGSRGPAPWWFGVLPEE